MNHWIALVTATAMWVGLPLSAFGERIPEQRIAGVAFDGRASDASMPLRLNGAGLLRYLGFKGYAAALYLGEGVEPDRVLEDVPRRLEIQYFRSISAERFAQATVEGIEKNVGPLAARALAPEIERFNRLYATVDPGDRYVLTYLPSHGTELSLNGRSLGRVEGADFSRALFSIWLGPNPLDAGLKTKLLGKES